MFYKSEIYVRNSFLPLIGVTLLSLVFQTPSFAFAKPVFQNEDPIVDPSGKETKLEPKTNRSANNVIELGEQPRRWPGHLDSVKTNSEIDQILSQPIGLSFDDVPFREIMEELSKRFSVNVLLDQSAINDSLDYGEPFSFSIKNVPLATAMRLMLQEKNATFLVDDGVIRIISKDVEGDTEFFRLQIYDCRKLLVMISRNADMFTDLPSGGGFGGGGAQFGNGGMSSKPAFELPDNHIHLHFGNRVSSELVDRQDSETDGSGKAVAKAKEEIVPHPSEREVRYETYHLIELIKSSITCEEWDGAIGDSTLTAVGGLLVLNGTQFQIEQTKKLLEELESTFAEE